MDPYRAAQPVDPPPSDKLKPVLVGAVLFLVLGGVVVIGGSLVQDYRASLPPPLVIEPPDTMTRSVHDGWLPPRSTLRYRAPPFGPNSKIGYETSSSTCYGDCIPYSVTIEPDGRAVAQSEECASVSRVASPAELADLRQRMRDAGIERYGTSAGPFVTDVPRLHTVVITDGERHDIQHVGLNMRDDPVFKRLLDLHDTIDQVAHVDPWLAKCRAQSGGRRHFGR